MELEKYHITYMWNLNYNTNELIYETDSDIENRLVVAKVVRREWDGLGIWSQ